MKSLIVSLHDTYPGSLKLVQQQRELLRSWGVQQCSILMVPQFHHGPLLTDSPETLTWANEAQSRGDELILHGYYHDRQDEVDRWEQLLWTRIYSNREAEFFDLEPARARQRLEKGLALFRRLGWSTRGFIAPAWLMRKDLPPLLQELGFEYTNTVRGIMPLQPERRPISARSLCWSVRAPWRRHVSIRWNEALSNHLQNQEIVRVSLHPHDFDFVTIRQQIAELIKRALDAGFEPVSYTSYVAR